jgi:hypothetical protein
MDGLKIHPTQAQGHLVSSKDAYLQNAPSDDQQHHSQLHQAAVVP